MFGVGNDVAAGIYLVLRETRVNCVGWNGKWNWSWIGMDLENDIKINCWKVEIVSWEYLNFIIEQDTMVQKHYRLQAHVLQLIKKNKYKKNKMKINLCEIEGKNTQDVKVYTYYKHPFLLKTSLSTRCQEWIIFQISCFFINQLLFQPFQEPYPQSTHVHRNIQDSCLEHTS